MHRLALSFVVLAFALIAAPSLAQEPPPPAESLEKAFPTVDHYSPYAGRNFPTSVFWGDTHLHTGMSMDAGAFGARLMPDDAYRFAKGQELVSSTGQKVRLGRPLDFLVVADHSDNMGFFPKLHAGDPTMLADPTGRRWYDMVNAGGQEGVKAAVEIIVAFSQNKFPPALSSLPGSMAYRSAWELTVNAAEAHNDPGNFTSFIGYEWTSNAAGNNLHRVVILRDDRHSAMMVVPYTTLPPLGSPEPPDLWKWMQAYEDRTGGRVLAIAHNGNMSNGLMFPRVETFGRKSADRSYSETRARWEPLYEATQIKGDGETHPFLSPDDEFADYETWDQGNLDLSVPKEDHMLEFEYARSGTRHRHADRRAHLGVNPYKFGMIGATDSHTGTRHRRGGQLLRQALGRRARSPSAGATPSMAQNSATTNTRAGPQVASGLAGVWAKENTREAIFDAMMRKETYATTGPRMVVRFFGGWEFSEADAASRLPGDAGYTTRAFPWAPTCSAKRPEGRTTDLPGGGPQGPLLGQPRPHPDHQGLARGQGWQDHREGLRRGGPAAASSAPTASSHRWATPWMSPAATWTNTIGAPELGPPSGPTRTSIPRSPPPTTPGCWRSPPRDGPPTKRPASA